MNKEEQIKWYWNHLLDLAKDHRDECTCHYCIQLIEKGYKHGNLHIRVP